MGIYWFSFKKFPLAECPGKSDGLLNGLVTNMIDISLQRRKFLAVVNVNHPNVQELDEQIT
jgi:hypothetical protein